MTVFARKKHVLAMAIILIILIVVATFASIAISSRPPATPFSDPDPTVSCRFWITSVSPNSAACSSFNLATTASFPIANNFAMNPNIDYCSGLTSGAIGVPTSSRIIVWVNFQIQSVNLTSNVFRVFLRMGSSAPATMFQAFGCAASTYSDFAELATATSTNFYSIGFTVSFLTTTSTLFAWVDVRSISGNAVTINVDCTLGCGIFVMQVV